MTGSSGDVRPDSGGKEKRAKEKLKTYVHSEITKLFSSILDYAEIAVDGKERYSHLRGKILKVSNDAIRQISREIDLRYTVDYVAPAVDYIIVDQKRRS